MTLITEAVIINIVVLAPLAKLIFDKTYILKTNKY